MHRPAVDVTEVSLLVNTGNTYSTLIPVEMFLESVIWF